MCAVGVPAPSLIWPRWNFGQSAAKRFEADLPTASGHSHTSKHVHNTQHTHTLHTSTELPPQIHGTCGGHLRGNFANWVLLKCRRVCAKRLTVCARHNDAYHKHANSKQIGCGAERDSQPSGVQCNTINKYAHWAGGHADTSPAVGRSRIVAKCWSDLVRGFNILSH